MELLQLVYFCHAAKYENFSKTAKEFQVPPSNISQSIHRLEAEMGVKLFDRSANKIHLNHRGALFYENVKKALSYINKAKEVVKDNNEISGEIRILVETNRRIVTGAVEKFLSTYKDVSFYMNNSLDENTESYDLIVTDRIIPEKFDQRKLLVTEDILLAIKKSNPLVKKENLSVSDLKNERFVTMQTNSGIWRTTVDICHKSGFVPNIAIQSDDPFYVRKYIEMGLGIAFIPATSWQGMFSDEVILRNIANVKRHTYAYYNSDKHFSNL